MDLMTLAAKLTLDDSSYRSGIDNATSLGQSLAGKMSSWTVAIGNLAADMVKKAASTITGIYSNAMDTYSDYQQLIGGVETLFKTSSTKVANYAANAYKTSGLSANDYMETVTSFSASLLQGLGGDTEAAADLADVAITDMADNANKMGTDISSIQTAYQGFAKQNYTMLDNLKLGYGGTQDEMVRLINDSGVLETEIKDLDNVTFDQMIEAIHQIQTEMGITGTTAAEAAETISGSKASLVSAWNNLMAAVGGSDLTSFDTAVKNFQDSFSAYMTNLLPTLVTTVANSGNLASAIATAISSLPTNLMANLTEEGLGAGAKMIGAVQELVSWLIDNIVTTFKDLSVDEDSVVAFGNALGSFIGTTAEKLLTNFPDLISSMIQVGVTLAGSILTGIWNGLFGDEAGNELEEINKQLTETITDANVQAAKAQSILTYMDDLIATYGDAAKETDEWKRAESDLEGILGNSKEVFDQYGDNIGGAVSKLKEMTEELRKQAIINAMQDKLTAQYDLLAQYELEKYEAEDVIRTNQGAIDTLNQQAIETAQAYQAEAERLGLFDKLNDVELSSVNKEVNTSEDAELVINGLATLLNEYYDDPKNGVSEAEKIWNQSAIDNILPEEEFDSLGTQVDKLTSEMNTAQTAVDDAQGKIDTVNGEITKWTSVVANASADLGLFESSVTSAANSLSSGLSSAISSVVSAASKVGSSSETYMPRAVGIDYVPTDNFKTELHRGEAVITAEDNKRRRYGYNDYSAMEDALTGAIEGAMSRMYINMSGEKVADITTRRTEQNISGYEHARIRSMGG